MSRPIAVALCAAALLAVSAAANAATVPGTTVHTRGYKIVCLAVLPVAGGGIECASPYVPDIGELDSYFALHRHGRAKLSERGDYPGYGGRNRRLADGDTWRWRGVRCTAAGDGVRCVNRSGHGFVIAAGGSRRF
ncbi:DUF6636 domain-containing protein [Capillimicrobium parvum]|uniref:Uncharacterized protein n=1 Tax=Capillimicrobium parvum TaxID=2884022 RepID=A0A9E6Y426_9ACTN|nr:DUF6636 domain-containing protein [Capillimicrobium parvum]UGS39305.1 hypothetical protein DSM104329_05740 [Capillimicrobium parvum]